MTVDNGIWNTPWSIKNVPLYFSDNSGKYWRIFVIFSLLYSLFSKESRNKNLLKFRLTLSLLPHYRVKLEMSVVSRARHWSIVPCAQVRCPVGIWNCHPIFPWCMATASPSAVLHNNSRRSLSLQVAQFHIPKGQHTCAQDAWHNGTFTPRDARLHFSRPVAPKQPIYEPHWLWDLGCNATSGLRETRKAWGENFNKFLFRNSLLNIVVKKLRKSVNICQSYRKNKSGTFFMDHSVYVDCIATCISNKWQVYYLQYTYPQQR